MNAIEPLDARRRLRQDFARRCGLAAWQECLLAGDASFRKYWRWSDGDRSLVVMDAPPPQENVRPFVRIARHLSALGLSAPALHAEDAEHGFLLLEDFGDDTYARALADRAGIGIALFARAADVLAHLHAAGDRALLPDLPLFLGERMAEIAAALVDWHLPLAMGRQPSAKERADYVAALRAVLVRLDPLPRTLVLRDYHAENLMWLAQRSGLAACGLLDFQDAETGVAAFDLVSLVEDARRDIPDELRVHTLRHYRAQLTPAERDGFDVSLAVCSAMRHSRVIGIFSRLKLRDGKSQYLQHLPRIWRLFDRALAHSELTPLRRCVDDYFPPDRRILPIE